jgi:predicted RNase H-like nuclease
MTLIACLPSDKSPHGEMLDPIVLLPFLVSNSIQSLFAQRRQVLFQSFMVSSGITSAIVSAQILIGDDRKVQLVGVDLAWHSDKNNTGLASGVLLNGVLRLQTIDVGLFPVDQLLQHLSALTGLSGIAIDASLIIPNQQGQRGCEKALSSAYGARGAACHASNTTLYPNADSVTLSRQLVRQGFQHLGREKWQIECYPHPAMIEMFQLDRRLAYKKGLVAERRTGQKRLAELIKRLASSPVLGLEIDPDLYPYFDPQRIDQLVGRALKSNEDALDAVICLYIAGLYGLNTPGECFGDINEGYIWVPQGTKLAD